MRRFRQNFIFGCFHWSGRTLAWLLILQATISGEVSTPADQVQVEIVGLSLAKPDVTNDAYRNKSLAPGRFAGTEVTLRVRTPNRAIVDAHLDEVTISGNGGRVISKVAGYQLPTPRGEEACTFTVWNSKLPDPATSRLLLKGSLVLRYGIEPETKLELVRFQKGQRLRFAGVESTISKVGQPEKTPGLFGFIKPEPFAIELETVDPSGFKPIQKIEFLDSSGQAIESTWTGSTTAGDVSLQLFTGEVSKSSGTTVSYGLDKEIIAGAIRVTYFNDVEERVVPFDVSAGLGL